MRRCICTSVRGRESERAKRDPKRGEIATMEAKEVQKKNTKHNRGAKSCMGTNEKK